MTVLVEKWGPQRVVLEIHPVVKSASVNNNGGGQVNHVNAAENQFNAPQNVLKAGRRPNQSAAATSSGGGMRKQPVNLVHGVPDELASSTCISSASDTVASSMSIVSTRLSRALIHMRI